VRRQRAGETAFKLATAKIFYRLLSRLAEIEIPRDTGDFRLMSRRALDAFLALPEQARFIRGMVAWVGFRQVPIVYDRAERHAGETKYPLSQDGALRPRRGHRLLHRAAADGEPYRPVAGRRLGAAPALHRLRLPHRPRDQGWTSLMLVVVVLGAVQMFVLGMIGEYIGRLYIESKRRPLYIVSDIAGHAGGQAQLGHVAHEAEALSAADHRLETIATSDTPGGSGSLPSA
jgi:glycosyltransferase involved in cell wall biosynthesis